jgi:hypothetical protein
VELEAGKAQVACLDVKLLKAVPPLIIDEPIAGTSKRKAKAAAAKPIKQRR